MRIGKAYNQPLPFERLQLLKTWLRTYKRLHEWSRTSRRSGFGGFGSDLGWRRPLWLEELVASKLEFDEVNPDIRRSPENLSPLHPEKSEQWHSTRSCRHCTYSFAKADAISLSDRSASRFLCYEFIHSLYLRYHAGLQCRALCRSGGGEHSCTDIYRF